MCLIPFLTTMYMFVQNSKKKILIQVEKVFRTLIFHFSLLIFHLLQVRLSFASPPLQIRTKLDGSPFHRIGEKWDLHRLW